MCVLEAICGFHLEVNTDVLKNASVDFMHQKSHAGYTKYGKTLEF
jgi:hypothetical protein